jgi:hypothetical protein
MVKTKQLFRVEGVPRITPSGEFILAPEHIVWNKTGRAVCVHEIYGCPTNKCMKKTMFGMRHKVIPKHCIEAVPSYLQKKRSKNV